MPPRRACDVCYKRKIQCLIPTAGEPCDWCRSQDQDCTFDRVIQKDPNKRTTSDVVQELSQRVEQLEEQLQEALQTALRPQTHLASPWEERSFPENPTPIYYPSTSPATAAPARTPSTVLSNPIASRPARTDPTFKLGRCQIGTNWYFKGVGIFSSRGRQWIAEGAGQRGFLENFDIFGHPAGVVPRHVFTVMPDIQVLPPEATCRHLFGTLYKSKTQIVFPVLDKALFEGTIARAYDIRGNDLGGRAAAEACIWAMIASAARTAENEQLEASIEPDSCIQEAKRLLALIDGSVNLDSFQATLLIWVYQKMKGHCREASITFSNSCRMVCELGGHYLLSQLAIVPQHIPIFDEQTRLHIRSLFWLCYCLDKDIALRIDRPPLLTSDHCDVGGPGEYAGQTTWFNQARDTDLAKIKENASRLLCSPHAFKYTEAELLAQVRQLDDELEEWRLSIDSRYRPKLAINADPTVSVESRMSDEDRTHMINLQLDYLFTVINIHTLVRKCGDLERNLPDALHSVVHSSADVSIEAGRSVFQILESVVKFWKEDSVWVVAHYAPMAAMPLFVNILIHPVGNPADSDLEILSSIGNITRKIPTDRLSAGEIEHIQEISEFIMELVRLGQSAAWKAKKGERELDLDIINPNSG